MKKNIIIIVIIVIFIFFIFSFFNLYYANLKEKSEIIKQEKITYDIKYIDKKIIEISYILDDKNNIQTELENLYSYWNTVMLDLSQDEKIDKSNITDFR